MARDYRVVASEILDTIQGLDQALGECTFEEYAANWVLRRAVERGLEIISEASRHLPTEWTEEHPSIPWPKVRSLGNILRHEYHTIADRVLWSICKNELAAVKFAIETMLANHQDPAK
jgi:uncharacterized protein with HEPN domain